MAPIRRPTAGEPSRRSERLQVARAVQVSEQEAKAKSGITKKKRFRRPRQGAKCKLLKLPGEIRNIIYRYALVKPEKIDIQTNGPGEPALLHVCKRIRNEGCSIYYTENNFELNIRNFNGAEFTPFLWQLKRHGQLLRTGDLVFDFKGLPNWDNLVKWIRAIHTGPGFRPETSDPTTEADHVLAGAFGLAKTMTWLPWPMLEEALNAMHNSLAFTMWGDKFGEDW